MTAFATPANRITAARGAIAVVAVGLAAAACSHRADDRGKRPRWQRPAALSLATAALVLDAVDGAVARRSGTATEFGARFDGEVDAAFIAALSVIASRSYGWWVAPAGLARYAFAAAGYIWPWMRRPLPPRYWRKVAAAIEMSALVATLTTRVSRPVIRVGLAVGSAMIVESFGRDVYWLYRRRGEERTW